MLTLFRNARLCTLDSQLGWGLIDDGVMVVDGKFIQWVGRLSELQGNRSFDVIRDLGGLMVTPGLVDCHTHLVYGGQRADEFEQRLNGVSYEDIARAGGGVRSTVNATRHASEEQLWNAARERALILMRAGVTTLEIKSGYGLSLEHESRSLRVARRLGQELPLEVKTTCLSAHSLPPEFSGDADAYINAVCEWITVLKADNLVDAVDAFCEQIAFSPQQIQQVFEVARSLDLPVKIHAEQLSNQGGAALAASYGALSCDHLEYLDTEGITAMAKAGSVAVLLPGAFYFLRETQAPPVPALRDAGIPIALATDHNPGTSPCLSPLLMLNMACALFRLTSEEALRGMTVNGARALGLYDRGRLAAGQRADFVAWPLDHPNELSYWLGINPTCRVFIGGQEV